MKAKLVARNPANGYVSIYAEYRHADKFKRVPTGVKTTTTKWNNEDEVIRLTGNPLEREAGKQDNATIQAVKKNLNGAITTLFVANGNLLPSIPQLNGYLAQQAAPAQVEAVALPTPLTTALAVYIEAALGRKGKWQPLTIKSFQTLLHLIEQYEVSTGITWVMETLTNAQVNAWQEWLMQRRHPKTKLAYKNSTLGKQVKKLKQFLNDAPTGSLNPSFIVAKVKAQHEIKVKATIVSLTAKEIIQLYNFPIEGDRMNRIKDLLLLECFTGLRYSDAIKICRADIQGNFIQTLSQKTVHDMSIPVLAQTKAILEKYDYDLTPLGISNQKANDGLRELFALPKLLEAIPTLTNPIKIHWERGTERGFDIVPRHTKIRTHQGRKSFISMAVKLADRDTVKAWSGHKSDASFSRYVDTSHGQEEEAQALQAGLNAL